MKTIKLNSKELKALKEVIDCNPCNSGCVYPEMQNKNIDCNDCEFTKSIENIKNKIDFY